MGDNTEAAEVTFVGGRAVEQHEALESNLGADERSAAKAAVREAIAAASKEAGEEAAVEVKSDRAKDPFKPAGTKTEKQVKDAEAKTKPASEEPEEEVIDPDKATLKQLLRSREKVANIKRQASDEVSQARAEAEQMRQEIAQQMQQLRAQQYQMQQQQQAWSNIQRDPASAVRAAGLDPEQFILDLAKEGTPEGAQERRLREMQSQMAQINEWRVQQAQQDKIFQEQRQHQAVVQHRQSAVQEFTRQAMDEEKYPHISNIFGKNTKGLVALGDITAEEYRELSGGKEGSFQDILDYIEDELASNVNTLYTKRQGQQVKTSVGKAVPAKSKGKSLSPDNSGERRTLEPKVLRGLDEDERLEAARGAVAAALANSRD